MATKKKLATPKKAAKKTKSGSSSSSSAIKKEISFTGSFTEHKDGSIFLFTDIHNNKEGSETKSINLSKAEVEGLKKFFEFLDF